MGDVTMSNTEQEEQLINAEFQKLIDAYLASRHRKKVDIITKAFNFAKHAHNGVRRLSGEPYILHPISVAKIVCLEIGLGSTSICSALLHDVVEDTDYTVEDIENMFGAKIAQIVDGLTKIAGGIFGDRASVQAETFKKLLLTMSDDIRVILIKIADRLHNMRTLGSQLPSKQYKIAGETLYIYAPLANRLGLNKIKEELEDLSFHYEHPEEYETITQKLSQTQGARETVFAEFTRPICAKLDSMGFDYDIKARVKTPYSIWCKMQNKHVAFEEIYDILAVRIIFKPKVTDKEINECFDIYVALTKIYKPHPDRLRDWLASPKANGYQALHVTLMSNLGQWIEVQIRSERMDEMAEQGFAAHWKYKEGNKDTDASETELEKWLHTIKEILDDPQPDAMDFLDAIKLNLFASEIFVFTPKGEIRTMPQNCTALDFAFSIHTFLGSHCIGAKVNYKLVPLSHKLQSGDQVEILTSKSQFVQPSWINFATTAKAKAKSLAILKREERTLQQRGEEEVADFFRSENLEYSSQNIKKLCRYHMLDSVEKLYAAVARKDIVLGESDKNVVLEKPSSQGWKKYITFGFRSNKSQKKEEDEEKPVAQTSDIDIKKVLHISTDDKNKNYVVADCCKPIPGDDVLGFIDDNNQIVIHKRQCPVATKLKSSFGNRLLAVEWESDQSLYFPVNLYIKGIDHIGLLNKITQVISQQLNVNIHKLTIESKDGIFEGRVQLLVHNVSDVKVLSTNLFKISEVKVVTRIENFDDKPEN